MLAVPTHIAEAFMNRDQVEGVSFRLNDSVVVTKGEHTGKSGYVISLLEMLPEPKFLVELQNGKDTEMLQSHLQAVDLHPSHALYDLLSRLEAAHIHFVLGRYRPDTITVLITVPSERIEVDVFDDGHLEVSRFKGDEAIIGGREIVESILDEYKD